MAIHGYVQAVNWGNALKMAAFQAFAAIGANDEEIRKKVISSHCQSVNLCICSYLFLSFSVCVCCSQLLSSTFVCPCPDYKIVVCMAQSSVALLKILICVPFVQLRVNKCLPIFLFFLNTSFSNYETYRICLVSVTGGSPGSIFLLVFVCVVFGVVVFGGYERLQSHREHSFQWQHNGDNALLTCLCLLSSDYRHRESHRECGGWHEQWWSEGSGGRH